MKYNTFTKELLLFATLLSAPIVISNNRVNNDSIKVINLDEVEVKAHLKETAFTHTLTSAATFVPSMELQIQQMDNIKLLSNAIPNLFIPDYGSRLSSAVYIRGIGARSSGQSVGVYLDGVPLFDKSSYDFELNDIATISVLRGPQGTLYGRNAMGGIIDIKTYAPLDRDQISIQIGGGSQGYANAKAVISKKIANRFGISASAYYNRTDGFFTNETTGKRADWENNTGGRLKLQWKPTTNLDFQFTSQYDYTQQGAFPYAQYDSITSTLKPISANGASDYLRHLLTNSLQINYTHTDFTLSATTGYQLLNDRMNMDQDFTADDIFHLDQQQQQNALSQEILFKSTHAKNYKWLAGAFGFYDKMNNNTLASLQEAGIQQVLQPVFNAIHANNPNAPQLIITSTAIPTPGTYLTPNYGLALYHQSSIDNVFTSGLSVLAAIRLDYEHQKLNYHTHMAMDMVANMGVMQIPMTLTDTLSGELNQESWNITPKVSLSYNLHNRLFTYATVSTGYKSGGYNIQNFADLIQQSLMASYSPNTAAVDVQESVSYDPERVINYELGARGDLIKNRWKADIALFYMDIYDIQLTQFVTSGSGRIISNGGRARSCGLEINTTALLGEGFTLNANYGFTNAKFMENGLETTSYAGNYVPYAPQHTYSATLTYDKHFNSKIITQLIATTQFAGAANIFWNEENSVMQKAYGTLNASLLLRRKWLDISIWAKNITNAKYQTFYFESFGNAFYQQNKPFSIGANVACRF